MKPRWPLLTLLAAGALASVLRDPARIDPPGSPARTAKIAPPVPGAPGFRHGSAEPAVVVGWVRRVLTGARGG